MKRFAAWLFLVILPLAFMFALGSHRAKTAKWQEFEKCIEAHPSDAVCDSCYQLIFLKDESRN